MSSPAKRFGFVRTAVCSPELRVADVRFNAERIHEALLRAEAHGTDLVVFPELCLTGYSCGDLLYQPLLLDAAKSALVELAERTASLDTAFVLGLPMSFDGKNFNCAAFVTRGQIKGIVPKTFLPGTQEFYEERWFSSALDTKRDSVLLGWRDVPFGTDLIFRPETMPDCAIAIELCEDVWAVAPPSADAALNGATVLVNLSASNEVIGKYDYRKMLVQSHSARCLAAYCYAAAGAGESSTDLVFSGHSLIAENGRLLAETKRFSFASEMVLGDIDVERLSAERRKNSTFGLSAARRPARFINFDFEDFTRPDADALAQEYAEHPERALTHHGVNAATSLLRPLSQMPFVPRDSTRRSRDCEEIFAIQTTGLAKRLRHTNTKNVVIGVSGGLDSTLALLVCVKAFDMLGLARAGVISITMPGFGTTTRTRGNAEKLAEFLGTTLRIISINDAVRQHFRDIGHDENTHDITYENAQARERTQILMDVANQVNGLVIGTGDLSELALGWCTYNADQMSMYGVNASIPKTLVRYLVEWCADHEFSGSEFSGNEAAVLHDICATPVSPELLPLQAGAVQAQETEKTIGPYELHDFFLYYFLRYQFAPRKIMFLAKHAFRGKYDDTTLQTWLQTFFRRFFTQQFKRSVMPDGPKVGTVALSPRGDWRMPSDASAALWLAECEAIGQEISV
ncbi:MAG: NAD(+) synthase [Candidatus Kapaibacterium sp.]|nr:MAG: NAD(+) synthase [Candidatus Kapabacteria bacterium]